MQNFCKNSERLKGLNYCRKNVPSLVFDSALNTPLHLKFDDLCFHDFIKKIVSQIHEIHSKMESYSDIYKHSPLGILSFSDSCRCIKIEQQLTIWEKVFKNGLSEIF